VPYHILGIPLPLETVQLLYRSTSQLGQPTVNVTSIIKPPWHSGAPQLVAYQSYYNTTNPSDEPSVAIAGGISIGDLMSNLETFTIAPLLSAGYDVAVADIEGQNADFADGPEYGMNTLDGIRAALASPQTGLSKNTKVGMLGYSGGAVATDWAAELAPSYAPDLSANLVAAAEAGLLVDPAHNMQYLAGSLLWAGMMPMALVGISRAFGVDLTPYLNSYGKQVLARMQSTNPITVFGQYAGLTWSQLALPQYPTPESMPIYAPMVNKLIMGTAGTPQIPMMIGQAANGILEGTAASPAYGAGDGAMIAGDVRTLARQYCAAGVKVDYTQYDALSHLTLYPLWFPKAIPWLMDLMNGVPASSNCASIAPGNPLTPIAN
jgi:hypothetical protein